MFVDEMIFPWIRENVQVVAKLSRIDAWNQQSQKKDNMILAREDIKTILSYDDFQDFNVIYQFPELSSKFLRNGIKVSLLKIK